MASATAVSVPLAVPAATRPFAINRIYAVTILAIHVLALLACVPWCFSWIGFWAMVIGIHVFGQGITIGYHRLLTHRSFKTHPWVERGLAILGMCCLEDSPARWVAVHRIHHAHSDEQADPHSPLVTFLWSHFGWLMVTNRDTHSLDAMATYAKDLLRDPFYKRIEKRPWTLLAIGLGQIPAFFLAGAAIGWLGWGPAAALQMGTSLVVWGVFVRVVAVWHITWSVNSLAHLFGYRNYETGEGSRNNWLVALLTVGEGWHNNHHQEPTAASVQHRWWEIDISYYEILLLEHLGLAWDVVKPRRGRRRRPATESA
ncbi:MAG: acyl-CoA desaturase [Planctomycetaceae bacterium]